MLKYLLLDLDCSDNLNLLSPEGRILRKVSSKLSEQTSHPPKFTKKDTALGVFFLDPGRMENIRTF